MSKASQQSGIPDINQLVRDMLQSNMNLEKERIAAEKQRQQAERETEEKRKQAEREIAEKRWQAEEKRKRAEREIEERRWQIKQQNKETKRMHEKQRKKQNWSACSPCSANFSKRKHADSLRNSSLQYKNKCQNMETWKARSCRRHRTHGLRLSQQSQVRLQKIPVYMPLILLLIQNM